MHVNARAICWLVLASALAGAASRPIVNNAPTLFCDSCKTAVQFVDDAVSAPDVSEKVIGFLQDTLCGLAENVTECQTLTRDVVVDVVALIHDLAEPTKVCTEIGLCDLPPRKASLVKMAMVAAPANLDACPVCKTVITTVKSFGDETVQVEVFNKSLEVCGSLSPAIADKCVELITKYEPKVFAMIQRLDPDRFCAFLGLCPAPPAVGTLVGDDDDCQICEGTVGKLRDLVSDPEIQNKIVTIAKTACAAVPSVAEQCVNAIDQYYPIAIGVVLSYLQPGLLCPELGFCPQPPAVVVA